MKYLKLLARICSCLVRAFAVNAEIESFKADSVNNQYVNLNCITCYTQLHGLADELNKIAETGK